MADLATPYPSQVFLTLFGLPLEDRERLIAWKDAIIDLEPGAEIPTRSTWYRRRSCSGTSPKPLTHNGGSPGDGHPVRSCFTATIRSPTPRPLGLSFVFVLAGLDTVTSAIGAAMLELARRPDLCARTCAKTRTG